MYSSAYQFEFDAGHDVLTPHRHTFRVRVECAGPIQSDGPSEGMVIDFRLLAAAARRTVRAELDGRMLTDDPELAAALRSQSVDVALVEFRPTVEHLARYCFERLADELPSAEAATIRRVVIWENDACMASYEPAR